jgi:hypothetical protein
MYTITLFIKNQQSLIKEKETLDSAIQYAKKSRIVRKGIVVVTNEQNKTLWSNLKY